ncbi:class I SAM-dependent methyltransferase [Actinoplanes sp. NPDC051851]|uniref:class I SAM-dependent methyltransferase n=1 Tax=Actinoplanes sp. NPDC051851 TaxID=3154753 RepID=UPI00341F6491
MLDYDAEADHYDRTRGGRPRAVAAAGAVLSLLPGGARVIVDVACGTGIVTEHLSGGGRTVLGVDRTAGMIAKAAHRLPGRAARGDALRLPLRSSSVDAVVLVWLLHLLPDAAPVIAEATRVLRPGGRLITTVDKNEAAFAPPSDLSTLTAPLRREHASSRPDAYPTIAALCATHGHQPVGETTFPGHGQGRSPRQWISAVTTDRIPWVPSSAAPPLLRALAALPDQDAPRPDPLYRLTAFATSR